MANSVPTDGQLSLSIPESISEPSRLRPRRGRGRRERAGRVVSKGAVVLCQHCGREIQVPEWYRDRGLSLHYCGAECRKAWTRRQPSFEVVLQPGRRGRGANWEVQSRRARERDGFTCQVCGVTEEELGRRLDVHHRIPFGRFHSNVEANKLEHLVSVCPACHQQLEAQLRRELPLFARP